MQSVYVVQINPAPENPNAQWETVLDYGIYRNREDAEETMFMAMANDMRNGIDDIREMTSTKRGKGKVAFTNKVHEITWIVPRSYRVHEIHVLPLKRW